ncbi:hypothetical protein OIU84_026423, partial [Salix udensis]
MEADAC